MRRGFLMILALVTGGLMFSCTKTDNKTVARVGKEAITVKMIKDDYLAISPSARPDLKTIDEKEAFAKDIASKEVMKIEARNKGLDRLPEIARLRQQTAMRRAWQSYFEDQVRARVKVTDKDLQDLYAKQNMNYHLGWILVRSKTLADELLKRIQNGEDFGTLAARSSLDPSRTENGDMGMRTLGAMPAPVEEKVITMSPGEVSGVIPFDAYYIIVKLIEKLPAEPTPFEEARQGLEAIVKANKENARQRELAGELRKAYELNVNDGAVDLIVSKTQALYPTLDSPPGQIPSFSDEDLDRELARWKGGVWKVKNYVDAVKQMMEYMRPGHGADRASIEMIISDYITGQLWGLEIKNKGYDVRPEVAREADRAVEEAIVTALHDELVKDVKADSAKIATFYEEHKAEMISEAGVRLAVIVSKDEAESKAVHDQLKAGAKFEALARQKSTDTVTGEKGGELPSPISNKDLQEFPDLEEVVKNLQVGAYSAPMAIPPGFGTEGYMVVKLLERLEPKQLTLSEVRQMLEPQVLQMEQDKVFGDWLNSKIEEYKVEIFPEALNGVDFTQLKSQGA